MQVDTTYLNFSKHIMNCQLCGRWTHTACAGVDYENIEKRIIYCCPKLGTPYCPYPEVLSVNIKMKNTYFDKLYVK